MKDGIKTIFGGSIVTGLVFLYFAITPLSIIVLNWLIDQMTGKRILGISFSFMTVIQLMLMLFVYYLIKTVFKVLSQLLVFVAEQISDVLALITAIAYFPFMMVIGYHVLKWSFNLFNIEYLNAWVIILLYFYISLIDSLFSIKRTDD